MLEKQEKLLTWGGFDDRLPAEKASRCLVRHGGLPSDFVHGIHLLLHEVVAPTVWVVPAQAFVTAAFGMVLRAYRNAQLHGNVPPTHNCMPGCCVPDLLPCCSLSAAFVPQVTVILHHMFAPGELGDTGAVEELEGDVVVEAGKLGPVEKVGGGGYSLRVSMCFCVGLDVHVCGVLCWMAWPLLVRHAAHAYMLASNEFLGRRSAYGQNRRMFVLLLGCTAA